MDEWRAIEAAKSQDIVVVEEGEGLIVLGFIYSIDVMRNGRFIFRVRGFGVDYEGGAEVARWAAPAGNIRPATLAEEIKFMDLSESMGVYQ